MNTPITGLTLSAAQQVLGGPTPSLRYPTAAELRSAPARMLDPIARFERSYVVEPNGCWRWTKARTTSGYGHFHVFGRYYQAHLISYILHVGPLPEGLEPDHLCRNRWCVNANDLEFVTHAVNAQRGVRAYLTPDQVAAIRDAHSNGAGVRALGRQYGVNHATVSRIVNGLIWVTRPESAEVAA